MTNAERDAYLAAVGALRGNERFPATNVVAADLQMHFGGLLN